MEDDNRSLLKKNTITIIINLIFIVLIIILILFSVNNKNIYKDDNNNINSNNTNTNSNNNNNNTNNTNTNNNNNNTNTNNNNDNNNTNNDSNNNNDISVQSISLSPTNKTIKVGESFTIAITINPTNATNKTITFKTSNNGIVTIDQNGRVTGVKAGTVTITATSKNGKTATCTVIVNEDKPVDNGYEIKYNKKSVTKIVGNRPFKNTLTNTGTNNNITYKSSNKKVAIVDKKGVVKLVGVGKATITATINDNNYKVKKASYDVISNFNIISYSEISGSGKAKNSIEHIKYAVKSTKYNSIKVDLQPTKDGNIVLCHDSGFTLEGNCNLNSNDLSKCTIVAYNKDSKKTVQILNLTTKQIKTLKYKNGDTVAMLEDYVKIMNKHPEKMAYVTVRKNIIPYIDKLLSTLGSDLKKRTIINSTSYDPLPEIRKKDSNIMFSYVVSDSSGDISLFHAKRARDLGNCIMTLFIFRAKPQEEAYESIKTGYYKSFVKDSIDMGVPVHVAIVSKKEYVGNSALGTYGVSGAQITKYLD